MRAWCSGTAFLSRLLLDGGQALGSALLALGLVEKRFLAAQPHHRLAMFGAGVLDAGRDGKALLAFAPLKLVARRGFAALAGDARTLGGFIRTCGHENEQQRTEGRSPPPARMDR